MTASIEDGQAYALPETLNLKAAAGLYADLSAARGHDFALDAADVQRLGGQCLQVLLAASEAWRADGLELSIINPSDAFTQTLSLFGATFGGATHKETLS
jgi:chemotaxis protein CheX